MAIDDRDYQTRVINDIEENKYLRHPVNASLFERLFIKKLSIRLLHPNPDDEFSMENVGPHFGIVSDYEAEFRLNIKRDLKPVTEPLVVKKLSSGGYMLLNGHHRWYAACRIPEIKKVPVEIINVTSTDDIIKIINSSNRRMCASFDLDEVLLTDGSIYPAESVLGFPFKKFYPKNLRKNVPALIKALHEMGFDVWIYSGDYKSEQYLNGLLRLNKTQIDGIVCGTRNKKNAQKIRKAFTEKYQASVHIDTESILCVNTKTKEYETYELDDNITGWAGNVIKCLKSDPLISNIGE